LKDGQIAATTLADSQANFNISVSGLAAGTYTFAVYSEDLAGRRSNLLTFPVTVTAGVVVTVGGVFIAPTIALDKSEVRRGDTLAVFGQSVPNADVTIMINSPETYYGKIKSDAAGTYLFNFDTTPLQEDQHSAEAKSALGNEISATSALVSFKVGDKSIPSSPAQRCGGKGDINGDCKVNLVDFSITAFWYKRALNAEFTKIEKDRLNNDGKVDLVDFSIMAFYWTG
jgi:hypothetical protein